MRLRLRLAFRTWVPAVGWTLMTVAAAGELLSAEHTSGILLRFLQLFSAHVDIDLVATLNFVLRKSGHFTNYAILSWLWFRAFRYRELRASSRAWHLRWALWGCALTVATAIADEVLQSLVTTRTGTFQDVLLDAAGASAMQLLLLWVWRKRRREASVKQSGA